MWARRLPLLALIAAATCVAGPARASTFMRVGVDSNLLVLDDGRLLFTQSDGSLTALDLATGEVRLRRSGHGYSGTFVRVAPGILLASYDRIAVLDPTDFQVRWETPSSYAPNLVDGMLVSYDGNGRVEARAVDSGRVLWSHDLPGALRIDVRNGRVLLHRTYGGPPTVELLDLATGRTVFSATSGNYTEVSFDGRWLFLPTGRVGASTEWAEIRDGDGVLRDTIEVPREWAHPPKLTYPTPEQRYQVLLGAAVVPGGPSPYPSGDTLLTRAKQGLLDEPDREASWQAIEHASALFGVLHHFPDGPSVRAGTRAVVSSRRGFVECVDLVTGKSVWLYRFPALDHQISGGFPHGMGPRLLDRALKFRREWKSFALDLGGKTRFVVDPQPYAPFPALVRQMVAAALAAVVPVGLAVWLSRRARRPGAISGGARGALSLALALAPWTALGWYARVALVTTLLLKLSIAVLLAVSIGSLRLRERASLWGVVTIVGWCALLIVAWPLLMWG